MTFPNFPSKYKEIPLVTPENFMHYRKKIGRYPTFEPPRDVILCYDKRLENYIVENHSVSKMDGFFGNFYLLEETDNKIGVIANFGIGGPIVAILVEELSVFGVERFLSIGIAGSLQQEIQLGSIIVCNKAIRDEGTSHHYVKSQKYAFPSDSMTDRIETAIGRLGLLHVSGTTWTIDAPYRETTPEVAKYREEGVLTVDMEAATLFAVAKYRNVESGAVFTISDYLGEKNWRPAFHLTDKHLQKLFAIGKLTLTSS